MTDVLGYSCIGLGAALALWGLFHQLIVGGAVTNFKNIGETEARLFIMGWVAQGAFMTFAGILPPVLILFFGPEDPAAHVAALLSGVALVFLAIHVFVTGFVSHWRPIQIGAILELAHGIALLAYALFAKIGV